MEFQFANFFVAYVIIFLIKTKFFNISYFVIYIISIIKISYFIFNIA